MLCGIPIDRPALGVNRLCGSGFQSIVNGAQDIILGAAKIALTGGVDNMSASPFIVRNVRFGSPLGVPNSFEDSLWVNIAMVFLANLIRLSCALLILSHCTTSQQIHGMTGWFDRFLLQIPNGNNR